MCYTMYTMCCTHLIYKKYLKEEDQGGGRWNVDGMDTSCYCLLSKGGDHAHFYWITFSIQDTEEAVLSLF